MEKTQELKRKAFIYALIVTFFIALIYIIFVKYEKESNNSGDQIKSLIQDIKQNLSSTSQSINTGKEILSNKK